MGRAWPRTALRAELAVFGTALACLYVAGRLWSTTRTVFYLEQKLAVVDAERQELLAALPPKCSCPGTTNPRNMATPLAATPQSADADVMHWSVRAAAGDGPSVATLRGQLLEADLPGSEGSKYADLLGAIEGVEAGAATGWACLRNAPTQRVQVTVYVDGVKVGTAAGGAPTPHLLISRLCEGETSESDGTASALLGWRQALPPLPPGRHEVRAFLTIPDDSGSGRRELNQSPLPFIEATQQPHAHQALARKDTIIRVRNAQVSQLWDELHMRQPWRNALTGGNASSSLQAVALGADTPPKYLAVIAINTGFSSRAQRDLLRSTWVPTGKALQQLEDEDGIVIRFIIGRSDQPEDPMEKRVAEETSRFGDIIRLDSTDTYADLASKTLKLFSKLPDKFDASFYFKVDDDVLVNLKALAAYLRERRTQGNLYMGCMKSGAVLSDRKYKWFEPDSWRFGDGADGGAPQYMRHASGQFYGVSAPVARYIKQTAPILHKYANEDITVGTWLLGLDVDYVNEKRMCCANQAECTRARRKGHDCLGFFEMSCAGVCNPEVRLPQLHKDCVLVEDGGEHKATGTSGFAGLLRNGF
mmetsp:Transcript_13969/g.42127  ORF Transcript_13969/g.42127 Transcript_13969/m.42127 type:complete len:589 (-) Transcript_13969:1356-3122(-)